MTFDPIETFRPIVGEQIIGWRSSAYDERLSYSVTALTQSGINFKFISDELPLGTDDCFQLKVTCVKRVADKSVLALPSVDVDRIDVFARDEWIELSAPAQPGLIGSNPRLLSWGPVGAAPDTADYVRTVLCGIILGGRHGESLLVQVADFPALIAATNQASEITAFIEGSIRVAVLSR